MTDDDLTRIVLLKMGLTWDEIVGPHAASDDLDFRAIQRLRTVSNANKHRQVPNDEDDRIVIEELGLVKDHRPLSLDFAR